MSDWVLDDEAVHEKTTTCEARGCHPVVVIDPESAEDVERLEEIFAVHCGWSRHLAGDRRDHLTAALREFAAPTPPRPDEPQGLGAVVEDAKGRLHIRTVLPTEEDDVYGKPWSEGPVRRHWQIVDAVRVLSEGVTP